MVGGMDFVHRIGVKKSELIPVSLRLRGAGSARLDLIGGLFLDVSIILANGEVRRSSQMCYIAHGVKKILLSKSACKDLGIIRENFPEIEDNNVDSVHNKLEPP